ncbi:MGMT family protein [Roseivirga sp. E12]|uniref:MGMT family protein n=1 Tax=Roseivirga sp. E12 TaxID=2819237 RepID=UPI001ABC808D|nr:MGMT family protein [Roseivirga sp. E12]MBO3698011.1 MGMT family protein [Roseivirga sp. E12]
MSKKKSTREKLMAREEKIHVITPEWEHKYGKGKLLVPHPRDIENIVNTTNKGELLTNDIIRDLLAKERKVQVTDPISVGIFLKILGEVAEEERLEKKESITPYWRVLKPDGSINIKFHGGVKYQEELLRAEGFELLPPKGKKPPKVADFEKFLKTYG